MMPSTVGRVPAHSSRKANERIREKAKARIQELASADPDQIEGRLRQLDQEWDIERTLEANAATVALAGLGLGAFGHRRFLALPVLVAGFLLLHAVQGWCPPLPLLRRLGFRTQSEIEEERYALKALRGDFKKVDERVGRSNVQRAGQALDATGRRNTSSR